MKQTENIKLMQFEGTDKFDYKVINENWKKVDDAFVDYIVEQGMIDGWTYRKWNSGMAEMWRYATSKSFHQGTNDIIQCAVNLPFMLKINDGKNQPTINVSGFHYQHAACYITLANIGIAEDGHLVASAMMKCVDPGLISSDGLAAFNFYIMGMWK